MKSHVMELLDRGIAAMLSAIELYNKPSFHYRREAFSILVINAWELLKAKMFNNNKLLSLWVFERITNKNLFPKS